jgi:hypothetical protein
MQIREFLKRLVIISGLISLGSWMNIRVFAKNDEINLETLNEECNYVRALYIVLLERRPNQKELEASCLAMKHGVSKKDLVKDILFSREFINK